MNRFRDPVLRLLRQASRSPEGLSPLIGLSFAFVIIGTGFIGDDILVNGLSWHVIDLSAGAIAVAVFLIASRVNRSSHPHAVWVWILAGFLAQAAPLLVVLAVTGSVPEFYLSLLALSFAQYPLIMSALGLVISTWLMQRHRLRRLASQRDQLVTAEARLLISQAETQAELDSLVGAELRETLESLENSLTIDQDISQQALKLRAVIDSVVRPLSTRLATPDAVQAISTVSLNTVADSRHRAKITRRLSLKSQFSPLVFALAGIVFIGPPSASLYGPNGFLLTLGYFVVVAVLLRVVLLFWGSVQVEYPLALIGIGLISYVIPWLLNALITDSGLIEAQAMISWGVVIVALLTSGMIILSARRQLTISEGEALTNQLDGIVMRLTHETWLLHQRYARLVHGTIQSRLLTAAMRLGNGAAENGLDSVSAVTHARQDLNDAIDALTATQVELDESFAKQMGDLCEAWAGVCAIHLAAPSEVLQSLEADAVARECVSEVLSEAISNAVKHAGARDVFGALALEGSTITLTVRNAVRENATETSAPRNEPGYGSTVISEATTTWSRKRVGDEVVLTAEFALQP